MVEWAGRRDLAGCGIDDEACEANAALIVSLVNAAPLLRRALAALEAVEKAERVIEGRPHPAVEGPEREYLLIPADAVEVSRG